MNLENKNYPKWHSIVIKIPSEMISKTKSGRVSLRNTITNLGALSTSNKMKSIKLISSNIDTPEIIENGVKTTLDNEKEPKQPKLKSTKEIDKLYNQMEQYNKELKNTKKLKTNKDHQDIINKILKEYINKKRTKKINELPKSSDLFDYYYDKLAFGFLGNLPFDKKNMSKNFDMFNKLFNSDPEFKKHIIHDYEGFKKGILFQNKQDIKNIIRENKIKTIHQYNNYIDKTNDLRLPYFVVGYFDNPREMFNYDVRPEQPKLSDLAEPEEKPKEEDNSFYVDASNSNDAVKLLRIIAKEKNGKLKIPLKIQTNSKLLNREIKKFLKIIKMSDADFMNRLEEKKPKIRRYSKN